MDKFLFARIDGDSSQIYKKQNPDICHYIFDKSIFSVECICVI